LHSSTLTEMISGAVLCFRMKNVFSSPIMVEYGSIDQEINGLKKDINDGKRFSVNVWAWITVEDQGACFNKEIYRNILNNIMFSSVVERFP
jgi:hypothetical protein